MLVLGPLSVLAGCGGSNNDIGQVIDTSAPQYCTVHANSFIGNVDFGVSGTTKTFNVMFKSVSNHFGIGATASTTTVSGTGSSTPLVSTGFTPVNGHRYTALVLIGVNGPTTGLALIDNPYNKSILSDEACICALNVLYNVPSVDVYVAALNVDLSATAPTMSSASYGGASPASTQDSIYVDGGIYQARVATIRTKNIVFASQPLSLANNADWLTIMLPAGGAGAVTPNVIRVLVAQTNDTSQTASELSSQQLHSTLYDMVLRHCFSLGDEGGNENCQERHNE